MIVPPELIDHSEFTESVRTVPKCSVKCDYQIQFGKLVCIRCGEKEASISLGTNIF